VRIRVPASSPLLEATNLSASYGKLQALHEVSFSVDPGETVAILGANGAGKTTTLRAICQLVATKGTVLFGGKPIPKGKPSACARLGIAMVPEGRGTFMDLSVEDNLRVGGITRSRGEVAADIEWSLRVFPRLAERRTQFARTLSGGEQQMLAIARALMSRPRLLLLDEPSLGLSPLLVADLFKTLHELASERGITMLLVEQNTSLALELAARTYVLETGRVVASGGPELIQNNEELRRAYLGY
jgi:branched-chain amino acid transport system ATP-binding protein